ncbi:RhoGAP domain containing protein [Ophiocordyceps camponoti-floridani]|uniref:RhoGAP domain containing protein n=1 Tax=Ophiocordyceps camponoti-floridani TaxID=2030778 RepID=A0A8H4Q2Q2_9HYPO|nr:RhoGAP domain containing protein [Ophiocordyceps camponoti-floridani]
MAEKRNSVVQLDRQRADSVAVTEKDLDGASSGGRRSDDVVANAPQSPISPVAFDSALFQQVHQVMASELSIPTLLTRLKQSIASAKEFALFLKKRSTFEDDHAQSLKKLCRLTLESSRRPEHRQGSFAQSYEEMVFIHDRMAENGLQFANSLHQMYEDLIELAASAERGRKIWKSNGMSAEQKVADLEQAMRKSKAKYDSLADEYDRARTGETRQGGKMLGAFKAHKSAAQHEEDLLRKVQAADQTYHGHVDALQKEKSHLLSTARPEAAQALQELIAETDAGVTLQMQKFAACNERLLLGNGLIISPHGGQDTGSVAAQRRSLREAVAAIDNTRDLHVFVAAHHGKIQPKAEVRYERNPLLNPPAQTAAAVSAPLTMNPPTVSQTPTSSFSASVPPAGSRSSTGNLGPMVSPDPPKPLQPPPHTRSFSHGNALQQQQQQTQTQTQTQQPRFGNGASQGPPQLGALPFQGGLPAPPSQARSGSPQDGRSPAYGQSLPVFGVPLSRLYERDSLAVPQTVHQCIQAVDLYGLGVEGIYRQSGSLNHINKLKAMFDADCQNPALDFRNPENFYHDVNSVTGLLKQFFRDLPDPLLTMEHHDAFIAAAKEEDDVVRRDSMHAIINALPDPNYATLRALTLHLHRVMDGSHVNRMNSHNLAVIFGPTLMGSDPSTAIADAGWQIKVIDTILQNTYQIFDDD